MTANVPNAHKPSIPFRIADYGSWFVALGGAAALVAFGLIGYGKEPASWMTDYTWYYAGGRCVVLGSSIYDGACLRAQLAGLADTVPIAGLAYPPHFTPFAWAFGSLPLAMGSALFLSANLIAAGAMIAMIVMMLREGAASDAAKALGVGWLAAIVLGNSGQWNIIWFGQITLMLALCLWLGFRAMDRGQDARAGVLLALVALKPQVGILAFFWVLLHGKVKVMAVAAATALLMAAYPLITFGPEATLRGWMNGVATYQDYAVNSIISVEGVPSLLANFGVHVPTWAAVAVGLIIVLIARFTVRSAPFSVLVLAMLVALQMAVYARPIDAILFAPAFILFWPRSDWRAAHVALFIAAVAIFCMPQRIVLAVIPFNGVDDFRTVFFLGLFALLYHAACRGGTRLTWPRSSLFQNPVQKPI